MDAAKSKPGGAYTTGDVFKRSNSDESEEENPLTVFDD